MSSHLLSTQEREDIFTRFIVPHVAGKLKPKERPTGIILGGQPGSGKSNFINLLKKLNPDAIPINGDDMRHFHPHFTKVMAENEEHAANMTQADCNEWIERLIDLTSNHKADIIIEGTMRRPEVVLNTSKLLSERGYNTEAIAIAVPPEISWVSTIYRFELQKSVTGYGRFIKQEGHQASLTGVSPTLQAIFDSPDINRLSLYSRRGDEYLKEYDNHRNQDTWESSENPSEVFNRLISKELSQKELTYTLRLLNESVRLAHGRNAEESGI